MNFSFKYPTKPKPITSMPAGTAGTANEQNLPDRPLVPIPWATGPLSLTSLAASACCALARVAHHDRPPFSKEERRRLVGWIAQLRNPFPDTLAAPRVDAQAICL